MTVRLVPFADEHVAAFAETITDPDVLRFTGVPEPTPDGWVADWRKAYAEAEDRASFAIVDDELAERDGFAGWAVAFHLDRTGGSVELGYAVGAWARGRGVASEALRQLSRWAFDEGLVRLVLEIRSDNVSSLRVAERVGYSYEGTQRSVHHKNGERVDRQLWSLLPGELL